MGNPRNAMDGREIRVDGALIFGAGDKEVCFIEEWMSDSPYIVAHTSGSTGRPKEIRLLKSDMITSARATNRFFSIGRDSQMVLPLSTDYIAGKMMVVRAIEAGASLWIEQPSSTPLSAECPERVDLMPIVPSQIAGLLVSANVNKVANVIIGGSPLSSKNESMVMASGLRAFVTYGMTETCSHVALRRVGNDGYYTPLPGYEIAKDERECLVVNSARMSFESLITNDMVEIAADGRFRLVGRYDNVINSGGVKIHPEVDERLIDRVVDGRRYYIASHKSEKWGEEPILVLEGVANPEIEVAILEKCRALLPKYHAPKFVVWVDKMDLTDSGKIRRKKF